ncbi:MAG: ribosome maturation factor RimM [Spirochaetota bacterium]
MNEDYLQVGTVTGVIGLDGGLRIHCATDFPERFSEGRTVILDIRGFKKEFSVRNFSPREKNKAVLFLDGITSREEAQRLNGCDILIPGTVAREFAEHLADDEYLYYDLLGCTVYYDGATFGTVTGLFEGGGGTILAVSDGVSEYQIPFVSEMVDTSKLSERMVVIYPVEGLIDR